MTNASGVMLLLNLIQVTESISGSVVPLAMFRINFDEVNWAGLDRAPPPNLSTAGGDWRQPD